MTKLAVGSLVVGLVAAALVLPILVIPAFQEINRNTAQLKALNEERDAAQTVQPAPETQTESPDLLPYGTRDNPTGPYEPAEPLTPAATQAPPAVAGPVSTGIANAHAPKPAPLLPGAGASVDIGGAPSCADLGNLKQAVNPTPRGTPYKGQLLIGLALGFHGPVPCTRARSFGNTVSPSFGKLQPGTYVHPTLGKFEIGRR